MQKMLPKMYKDLLGIASVLWIGWYPHQVVAEESLCHLDIRPQPYSLEEEVGSLLWEYPTVSLQWSIDQSRKNVWRKDLEQKQEWKRHLLEWNPQQELLSWNSSNLRMCLQQQEGTQKYLRSRRWTEEQPLQLQRSAQERPLHPRQVPKAEQKGDKKKAARKEEKRNKRMEKSARKAEEAEAEKSEGTPARTPVRRKLDIAMENAGSIESVILLEREYKALQRDPSHRPNFFFLIDVPRTVFGPAAGEEERAKLTKLREEEEAEAAQPAAAEAEEMDEGSASRKRKLDELEQKKKALEEENAKKQKEIEDEAKRIRAVEEAERRAKEQRAKNPKLQVPVAAEKSEKPETWFERKATELVESFIQGCIPQQKKE